MGTLLEVPLRGASNEYPQHIFSWRNREVYLDTFLIESCVCATLPLGVSIKFIDTVIIDKKQYLLSKTEFAFS